jgi:hypothetical protein
MTPTEFIAAARRKYNAVGNSFYSDAEILDLLYQMEGELARFALTIEATDNTTSTVAGTRTYAFPTRAISVFRLTYDGEKLDPISFSQDDDITLGDEDTTQTGTPTSYQVWGDTVYLRPVPDAVKTLNFYYYREPAVITISDSIETPVRYHMDMVDGVVAELMYKDENLSGGDRYKARWDNHKLEARKWQQKRRSSDGFFVVQVDEVI